MFRKLVLALLSIALLFGSSLPLLAASESGDTGERILLCTSSGLKWVEIDALQDGDVVESSCPWCRLDDDTGLFPALPGVVSLTLPAIVLLQVSISPVIDAPLALPAYAGEPGNPRAPPAQA